jgi:hypothetical protein
MNQFSCLPYRFWEYYQRIPGCLKLFEILAFVFVTSLAGIGNVFVPQGILWQQSDEHVTVKIPGFSARRDPRHMAAHAVGKRVDRMSQVIIDQIMTTKALF